MKKRILISITVLMVIVGASLAFAATPDTQTPAGSEFSIDKMIEACRQVVNNSVKEGTLTQDQAKAMNDQMNNMAPVIKDMMGRNNPNMMERNTTPMGQPGMMGQGTANQWTHCYDTQPAK